MDRATYTNAVKLSFIRPGKPVENGFHVKSIQKRVTSPISTARGEPGEMFVLLSALEK